MKSQPRQDVLPIATPGPNGSDASSTNSASGTPASSPSPSLIIKDVFQENANAESYHNMVLAGVKAAPVNLPGAAWQLAVGDGTYETNLTPPGELGFVASFHNTASVALNLASNGTYVKPSVLTISAELSFDGSSPGGYCLLGFYSALSGEHTGNTLAHFTGVALQKDGLLQLIENGVASAATLKYTGHYDPAEPVTLTYRVDTTKGTISNISLSGSTTAYAFTSSAFIDAATAYLGIGGTTDGNSECYFNNLQVWAGIVPPPSPALPAPESDSAK